MIILDVIIIMVVGFVPFVLFITLFRAMNMSILHLFVPLQRFTSKLKRKKVYENIVTDLPIVICITIKMLYNFNNIALALLWGLLKALINIIFNTGIGSTEDI